jgi:hypothetical protein
MNRPVAALVSAIALFTLAGTASARDTLGIFEDWGAFRDPATPQAPLRCYAIAEPASGGSAVRYATIGFWPGSRVRAQFHVRLANAQPAGTRGSVAAGGRRFALVIRGTSAWAADARLDAAIVAAIRSGQSMGVSIGGNGAQWRLRGAATAIDAAALACARR